MEGASHPEELIDEARHLGIRWLALTDRDGVYGMVKAHVRAREQGVELIVGSEITLDDGSTLVLLARNQRGYAGLCQLISKGRLRCPKGQSRVSVDEVCAAADGLIALWGGERALCTKDVVPREVAGRLRAAFADSLYLMLTRHQRASDRVREARLLQRAQSWNVPVVAAVEVLYHSPARRPLQDVLTCIREGVKLSTAGHRLKPNDGYDLKPPARFETLFEDVPEARHRTLEVAGRCTFRMDQLDYRYPSEPLPDGSTSSAHLRHLTFTGAEARYGGAPPEPVTRQLNKELKLIDELDYCGYFLTMWEIVQFCRREGILCQGRGSAANSAVCFCLGITAVDPVRMDLLFERFLSKERAEPPDIDLDIEHQRREEVIQYVYRRYGREHAAMVANVVRYRARSAVRDVGKVLGLAATTLDRASRLMGHYGAISAEALEQVGLDPSRDTGAHLLRLANEILDFPRHLSIHPGGFLLGQSPLMELVPVENATMEGRTVIQWDKDDVESMGLFKVDLLGLGALTQLHLCFDLLKRHRGLDHSMATLPAQDDAVFAMMSAGDTVGVFQIESRAQMAMLPRLRPKTFYDLVIEISIVRPGPISGGMVHPYLRRRNGEEEVIYPHESLRPVLQKTLGVPLFQEQVMKLAVVAADYTPGEADQLRRDMAAWKKSGRIEKHRNLIIGRMKEKGISEEFAERVFEQIRGFGEYGFPESHAASFALISYAASYLKCHYPEEFTCALLNAWPMGFYQPSTVIEDARRHGVTVLPVDVLCSTWDCTLEAMENARYAVRLGARYVLGLERAEWRDVERARHQRLFESLEDAVARAGMKRRTAVKLAEAGAFASLGQSRRDALWNVRRLVETHAHAFVGKEPGGAPAFRELGGHEEVAWDYRATTLSPRGHPLEGVRDQLVAQGLVDAATLMRGTDGETVRYAGCVICRQRPGTAKGVLFMTLEDETGFVNLVIWTRVFEKNEVLLKTLSFLGVTGKLQSRDGTTHLIVEKVFAPRVDWNAPATKSHDFH